MENFGGFGPGKDAHFDQNDLGSPSIPKPMPVPEKHMKIGMFTHATEAIRSEPAKSVDGGHRIELAQVLVGVPA